MLTSPIAPTAAVLCPMGSRGFYIRAHRAPLLPHVPIMLAAGFQAIGGTGTFTQLDPQPCRPLQHLCLSTGPSKVYEDHPETYADSRSELRAAHRRESDFEGYAIKWRDVFPGGCCRSRLYRSVNPPLRYNPLQTLGPGYALSAKESLNWSREVRFILNEPDYKRIHQLWNYALWPADAPDPDNAIENNLTAIKQLRTGFLRESILQSDVSPDDIALSATVRFDLIAPSEFPFDPALGPQASACFGQPTVPL